MTKEQTAACILTCINKIPKFKQSKRIRQEHGQVNLHISKKHKKNIKSTVVKVRTGGDHKKLALIKARLCNGFI